MTRNLDLYKELYGDKVPKRRYSQRSTKTPVYVPTEKEDAKKLIQWAYTQPILKDVILHIPNEGQRHPWQGRELNLIGMRAGVSDFFIPVPRGGYHGLWVELKRQARSTVSDLQQAWLDKMLALDYAAHVAYGFDDAKKIISNYLVLV